MTAVNKGAAVGSLIRGRSPGLLLVRRLLPVTIGLPLLVGLLRLEGERAGLYSATVGVVIMVAFGVLGATGLLVWTAASIERVDRERRRAEAAVRLGHDQHRALARNFPDGAIVLFDRELRHLIADGAGLAAVGLSAGQMEGKTIWQVFPAEVCATIEPPYRAALDGIESTFEYTYRERTYLVRVVPVRDEATGAVWGGAVIVRDVSARKREEAEMREANERFARIFHNAPIGEAIVAPEGRWLQVNRALCDLVGYSEAELLASTFHKITHPDDLDADLELKRRLLAGEIRRYRLEKRYLHKRGHAVSAQLSVSLVRDAQGAPLHFISQVEDITERKRAGERIRESEVRLAEAQKIARIGSWEWDLRAGTIAWSDELYRIYGLEPGSVELSFSSLPERIHPEDHALVEQTMQRARETGEPFAIEYRIVRPDGTIRWLQGRGQVAISEVGGPLSMRGTAQDVTDRKQAEQERDRFQADLHQAQKLEAIGQLASGVAHEFNNMLMAITGHSSLLLQRVGQSPLRRDVEQIVGAAERAGALTRQLLAFGRRQVLQPRTIDLNEVTNAGMSLLRPLVDPRTALVTNLDPQLPATVADPAQIEQVVINLVLNARDAIEDGGTITITTTTAQVDELAARREGVEPGRYLALAVADTGCGIDEQTRGRIFEPFFTTKEPGKGTGLGLSTADGIVRQGGGFLTVESKQGEGTIATLYLPLEADAKRPAERLSRPTRSPRRRVAVVADDEQEVRSVCAELLAGMGYEARTAGNGIEALRLLEQEREPIELLLTDVVMPHIGGAELARRIGPLHPETTVVYMSGHPGEQLVEANGSAGKLRFLQKPFTASALQATLQEARTPEPGGSERGPTCVVADDHPSVLDAVCNLLDTSGVRVLARASDATIAIAQITDLQPDVAVLDVAMPGLGGIEAARQIHEASPATRVLLYTGNGQVVVGEALAAGAHALVFKDAPLNELVRAVKVVANGGINGDDSLAEARRPSAVATPAEDRRPTLTARERDVLSLLAEGHTNEQAGRKLTISADTVQTHVRNAMKKLGADTRTQAVATAMRLSLIG